MLDETNLLIMNAPCWTEWREINCDIFQSTDIDNGSENTRDVGLSCVGLGRSAKLPDKVMRPRFDLRQRRNAFFHHFSFQSGQKSNILLLRSINSNNLFTGMMDPY
jgi:hypothetical protein